MVRYIACLPCTKAFKLHEEDVQNGWLARQRTGLAKKPGKDFGITAHSGGETTFIPMTEMVCDFCNQTLPEGSEVAGITMWRKLDGDLESWENEYMTAVTPSSSS